MREDLMRGSNPHLIEPWPVDSRKLVYAYPVESIYTGTRVGRRFVALMIGKANGLNAAMALAESARDMIGNPFREVLDV